MKLRGIILWIVAIGLICSMPTACRFRIWRHRFPAEPAWHFLVAP